MGIFLIILSVVAITTFLVVSIAGWIYFNKKPNNRWNSDRYKPYKIKYRDLAKFYMVCGDNCFDYFISNDNDYHVTGVIFNAEKPHPCYPNRIVTEAYYIQLSYFAYLVFYYNARKYLKKMAKRKNLEEKNKDTQLILTTVQKYIDRHMALAQAQIEEAAKTTMEVAKNLDNTRES